LCVGRHLGGKRRRQAPRRAQSHEHVIEHFGNLVASESGYLGQSGMVLGRARPDRMVADYGLVSDVTNVNAVATVKEARRFVDACKSKWTFYDKSTHESDD